MYKQKTILKNIKNIIKRGVVFENESFIPHTSFSIGGTASIMVLPATLEEIINLKLYLSENMIDHIIIGNGSNVLVSDKGFDGVVIKIASNYSGITLEHNRLQVLAGTPHDSVCYHACASGLSGMQEGSGIPGTVGGAVIMNASAFNFETSKVVLGVLAIINNKITYLTNKELVFDYRKSIFNQHSSAIILRVDYLLEAGEKTILLKKRDDILTMRKASQPLNFPSAGSVFKRIDGEPVSYLLDIHGFKGMSVGGASVSTKHAGFIINNGNASAKDVKQLISVIKSKIKEKTNIILEEEIIYIGEFDN